MNLTLICIPIHTMPATPTAKFPGLSQRYNNCCLGVE